MTTSLAVLAIPDGHPALRAPATPRLSRSTAPEAPHELP